MDQFPTTTTTTIPSSSPPPHLPLFLDSLPFLSPSSLLPFDPSHPLLPPSPSPAPPPRNSKKRSRASRRAPTTVLTTDTSNFRAMVQEFTGNPSPPSPLSLPPQSLLNFPPPFLTPPFSLKHPQTTTKPNTFFQSLIDTPSLLAAKPPYPSPPSLISVAGREELQQPHQGAPAMLDSWICSSDYK